MVLAVTPAVTMNEASFLLCYPCEREHDNPDFLYVRLLSSVVLAVTPAVTMDKRSSLVLLYLHNSVFTHAVSHTICGFRVPRRRRPVVSLSLRLKRESELQEISCVLTTSC